LFQSSLHTPGGQHTCTLSLRTIPSGLYKLLETCFGYFEFIDVESIQIDLMPGDFGLERLAVGMRPIAQQAVNLVRVTTHDKLSSRHQNHLGPVIVSHGGRSSLGLRGIIADGNLGTFWRA